MHTVHRGPEPSNLKPIRATYTPKWVHYYRARVGTKPTDNRWREFAPDLDKAFDGLCAFCEESCEGQVDHFRPKSKFPHLVYEWFNWLFICNSCNNAKGEKWPIGGYIDPCATFVNNYPELYFTFDTTTGEILPKTGLSSYYRQRAERIIKDLRLNRVHHLNRRRELLSILDALEAKFPSIILDIQEFRNILECPSNSLPSIKKVWLSKHGYPSLN